MNPTENLWWDFKKTVAAKKPKNISKLEAFAHEECAKIPKERSQACEKLPEMFIGAYKCQRMLDKRFDFRVDHFAGGNIFIVPCLTLRYYTD